jgi:hypothetical protein
MSVAPTHIVLLAETPHTNQGTGSGIRWLGQEGLYETT